MTTHLCTVAVDGPDFTAHHTTKAGDLTFTGTTVGAVTSLPAFVDRLVGDGFARVTRHGLSFVKVTP